MGGLQFEPERMRETGYRTVDALVEALAAVDAPPLRRASPAQLRGAVGKGAPEQGEPYEHVLERLLRDVLPYRSRGDHPGFLAFIPFAGTWPGALGDFVASALNVYAGSWMEGAGVAALELEVLRWFADWIGYPSDAGGALVSGGSIANLTAFACARETRVGEMSDRLVAYVGDQAHSSVARAARLLGFRPHQLRVLASRDDHRLDPDTLAAAIDDDLALGHTPLVVSASGGGTNTGVVDPLRELAAVCAERGVWLHVDAAYGGFAALSERGRRALDGIELADSVTLDPHKWLYQPYECGCLLVRDASLLEQAFAIAPYYLDDARAADGEVNFSDRGVQLTRAARVLKLWLSLRTFGIGAFREAIDRCLDLAEHARRRVEASERLELLAGDLGVVCLRRVEVGLDEAELEWLNAGLVAAVERSGIGLVSSTRLAGRYVIRLCVLSHTTTQDDLDRIVDILERADPVVPDSDGYDREGDVLAAAFAGLGQVREHDEGDVVVAQGEESRDFYLVIDGTLDVYVDGAHARTLYAGEFFGELAAVDWGAGFGYRRSATVVATSHARLLVIASAELNALVTASPQVAAALHGALRERSARR
jgi:glutamate/tyrosine decarboxylase-like PLP-dependent enzyme